MAKEENKKGLKNLIPFNELTEEAQREIASKGGVASAEAKREKKKLKETLQALMEMTDEATGKNNQDLLCVALFKEALKGNVQAFNSLRDTMGEKPVEEVRNTNINTEPLKIEIVE